MKELYLKEAHAYIPHLLELLDRSPVSPTYGCFDRNYWHYKATDFPAGMYEEYVLPLALLYTHDIPLLRQGYGGQAGNIYFQNARIREYIIAGMRFAIRTAHTNGSNDDYYPHEEALGSTTFSLYAASESYLLLKLEDQELKDFFKKRADWIISKEESGTLSNHHALAALTLYNVHLITGEEKYKTASQNKINETISYQSNEGWFQEYEGCDPGYLTFTIDFLGKYLEKNPSDTQAKAALEKAIDFVFWTVHPDGSYGGEYGSRNTYHFLPAGFEILAKDSAKAAFIRNKFLYSLEHQTRSRIDDDRIFGHYLYSFIQAYLHHKDKHAEERPKEYTKEFPEAGIIVKSTKDCFFICSLKKGGVFKVFSQKEPKLIASDCGIVLKAEGGTYMSQTLVSNREYTVNENQFTIKGSFFKHKSLVPTPLTQLGFRAISLIFGRYFTKFIRIILQKLLITGKASVPITFERKLDLHTEGIAIEDTIRYSLPDAISSFLIPTDFTAMYVATSQPYQSGTLIPWLDYSRHVSNFSGPGSLSLKRDIDLNGRVKASISHVGQTVDLVRKIKEKISIKTIIVLGLLTIAILGLLFTTLTDGATFLELLKQAKIKYLVYAILVTLPFLPLSALRWWFVLRAAGHRLSLREIFSIVLASGPLLILPGRLGDLIRSYPLKDKVPVSRSIATIIFEKVIDVSVLLLLSTIGLFLLSKYLFGSITLVLGLSFIPALFLAQSFAQSLGLNMAIFKKISSALDILSETKKNKIALLGAIGSSALNWLLSLIQVYFLYLAFGTLVPMIVVIAYLPLTIFAGLIPISLAGIGTRDSLMLTLFSSYAQAPQTLAMGLAYSFLGYFFLGLIGLPFFIRYIIRHDHT